MIGSIVHQAIKLSVYLLEDFVKIFKKTLLIALSKVQFVIENEVVGRSLMGLFGRIFFQVNNALNLTLFDLRKPTMTRNI